MQPSKQKPNTLAGITGDLSSLWRFSEALQLCLGTGFGRHLCSCMLEGLHGCRLQSVWGRDSHKVVLVAVGERFGDGDGLQDVDEADNDGQPDLAAELRHGEPPGHRLVRQALRGVCATPASAPQDAGETTRDHVRITAQGSRASCSSVHRQGLGTEMQT